MSFSTVLAQLERLFATVAEQCIPTRLRSMGARRAGIAEKREWTGLKLFHLMRADAMNKDFPRGIDFAKWSELNACYLEQLEALRRQESGASLRLAEIFSELLRFYDRLYSYMARISDGGEQR